MKPLLPELVRDSGFCCIRMFFVRTRRYPTGMLAAYLGVTKRTLRRWRADHRDAPWLCDRCANCQRNIDLPHPLDDASKARRYSDKARGSV